MKIPTRFIPSGDKSRARELEGFGMKILSKLELSLAFRKLPTGTHTINLADGSIIKATVSYGETHLNIFSPPRQESGDIGGSCECGKFFAEGVVVGITPVDGYVTPAQLYTVDVCQQGNTQITVQNCVAHDFYEYKLGERVWCSLDIREAIATYPFYVYPEADSSHFAFATPWGAVGTERGFTYTSCADTSGQYDRGVWPVTVSANALGPCGTSIELPDEDWQGAYPSMCSLVEDPSDCFWMYKTLNNLFTKDEKSLYTEYAMIESMKGTHDPEKDYSVRWLFNLQIIPKVRAPELLNYTLDIGRVTKVNPETNTVDVKIIKKFHHKECYNPSEMFEEYGEVIENVEIKLATDKYYFATEEEKNSMEYNEDAWSIFLPDILKNIPAYVHLARSQDGSSCIISCYRPNIHKQEDIKTEETTRQVSRRLFSTNKMYALIISMNESFEKTYFMYDLETNVNVSCGADISDLGTTIVGDGSSVEYLLDVFGYTGASLTYSFFGGWDEVINIDPYHKEAYGLVEPDAYWYEGTQPPNEYELASMPTLGENGSPNGGYSDVGSPGVAFSLTSSYGVVANNSSFYRISLAAADPRYKISVGALEITATVAYSIDVISGRSAYGATCGNDYFVLGESYVGTRNDVPEVVDALIYSCSPNNPYSRDTALEGIINALNLSAGVGNSTVNASLVTRPFGFRGLDFGDPITLTEYL